MKKISTLIALIFLIFTISANAYQNRNQCHKEIKKFWDMIKQVNIVIDTKENKPGTNNFIYQLVSTKSVESWWYGMRMGDFGRAGGAVDSLAKVRNQCGYDPQNAVYAYEQTKIRVENHLRSRATKEGRLEQYRNALLNSPENRTVLEEANYSKECQKSVIEVQALMLYISNIKYDPIKFTKEECQLGEDFLFHLKKVMQICDSTPEDMNNYRKQLIQFEDYIKPCFNKRSIGEKPNTNKKIVSDNKIVTVKGTIIWATLDSGISYKDGSGGVGFMTDSNVGRKIFSVCTHDDYCEVTGILNSNDFFTSVSKVKKIQEDIRKIDEQYGDLGLYETFLLKSENEQCRYTILRREEIIDNSCLTMTNSKGKKIVCTKTKEICKTTKELFDFADKLI